MICEIEVALTVDLSKLLLLVLTVDILLFPKCVYRFNLVVNLRRAGLRQIDCRLRIGEIFLSLRLDNIAHAVGVTFGGGRSAVVNDLSGQGGCAYSNNSEYANWNVFHSPFTFFLIDENEAE